jgi:hypothetical protein
MPEAGVGVLVSIDLADDCARFSCSLARMALRVARKGASHNTAKFRENDRLGEKGERTVGARLFLQVRTQPARGYEYREWIMEAV